VTDDEISVDVLCCVQAAMTDDEMSVVALCCVQAAVTDDEISVDVLCCVQAAMTDDEISVMLNKMDVLMCLVFNHVDSVCHIKNDGL